VPTRRRQDSRHVLIFEVAQIARLVPVAHPIVKTSPDKAAQSGACTQAQIGRSAWIGKHGSLSAIRGPGLRGYGKLCAARPARGLARRRGFRSGFSRLPADPTEPDDSQPWHPRRTWSLPNGASATLRELLSTSSARTECRF